MSNLPPAPKWAVPVRVPFHDLVLSRACSVRTAWLFSRGAKTSPLLQNLVLRRVREWRAERGTGLRKFLRPIQNLFEPEYTVEIQYSCRMVAAGIDNIANRPHRQASSAGSRTLRTV
jgi:hypothetical protein